MANEELKPCPFCGSKAHFKVINYRATSVAAGFDCIIVCSKCGCTPIQDFRTLEIYLDKIGNPVLSTCSQTVRQNMINEWNKRKAGGDP